MQKITNGAFAAYCGDDVSIEEFRQFLDETDGWGNARVYGDARVSGITEVNGNVN